VRMILFFRFLLCLHHRLLAALLCLLGWGAHIEIEVVGGADRSLVSMLDDKIGERRWSFFK
jgi:hypothetical protein